RGSETKEGVGGEVAVVGTGRRLTQRLCLRGHSPPPFGGHRWKLPIRRVHDERRLPGWHNGRSVVAPELVVGARVAWSGRAIQRILGGLFFDRGYFLVGEKLLAGKRSRPF